MSQKKCSFYFDVISAYSEFFTIRLRHHLITDTTNKGNDRNRINWRGTFFWDTCYVGAIDHTDFSFPTKDCVQNFLSNIIFWHVFCYVSLCIKYILVWFCAQSETCVALYFCNGLRFRKLISPSLMTGCLDKLLTVILIRWTQILYLNVILTIDSDCRILLRFFSHSPYTVNSFELYYASSPYLRKPFSWRSLKTFRYKTKDMFFCFT